MKQITLFSSGRSDFDQINNLNEKLRENKDFKTDIISVKDLSDQNLFFNILKEEDNLKNKFLNTGREIGKNILNYTDILIKLYPDLVIILGDRYEAFAFAVAANNLKIPIAHIHGGELTRGSMDDFYRHCITKMAHMHFASTDAYKKRIIQLGENPKYVYNVGSIGVENIKSLKLLSRHEIEKKLNITLKKKNFLVTYHPPTLEGEILEDELNSILNSLEELEECAVFFTAPNKDRKNEMVRALINTRVAIHDNWYFFENLGQQLYFSLAKHVDVVLGNSSSAIIEIPTLNKPTINIGSRQDGRVSSTSVINVLGNKTEILKAIEMTELPEFQDKIRNVINEYEKPNTISEIVALIQYNLNQGINFNKFFYDF
jgi:GDP/UDP-N,N'-diacetylbacillosamine 2-epimerase (hydrolysing)